MRPPHDFPFCGPIDWSPFKAAFPLIFRIEGDLIAPMRAGQGWFQLLWDLCCDLEAIAQTQLEAGQTPIRITTIKPKFAGLRCFVQYPTGAALDRIAVAETASEVTCEACGEPGRHRNHRGWFTTYCERHHVEAWKLEGVEPPDVEAAKASLRAWQAAAEADGLDQLPDEEIRTIAKEAREVRKRKKGLP